jgi:3',5'-cyclic AMP phosphodiesterase CpdA
MPRFRAFGAHRRANPLPRGSGTTRIVATGDSKPPVQREVFRLAEACSPDAVLFTGDAAYAGSSDSLRRRMLRAWRRDWGGLWERLYAVPGNHDFDSPRGPELWRDTIPSRSPSPPHAEGRGFLVRIGPVLAVGLDTTSGLVDALQREWLAAALTRSRAPHRVAVYHEPAFTWGFHKGHALDALPDERDRLWSTLEAGRVGVVLNGHEHAYARTEIRRVTSIQQIITGGAGGALYETPSPNFDVFLPEHHLVVLDADGSRIVLRALDLSGAIMDEIEIAPTRSPSATEVAT